MTTLFGLWTEGSAFMIAPGDIPTYWFVLPLVIAMSWVYSASRHESWSKITGQSIRLSGMILGILFLAMALLLLINTQV